MQFKTDSQLSIKTFLVMISLILSSIIVIPHTSSAEEAEVNVWANYNEGMLDLQIHAYQIDYNKNYTIAWATLQYDNVKDYGFLQYNDTTEEPWWSLTIETTNYSKGQHFLEVELYDDEGSLIDDAQDSFYVSEWFAITSTGHLENPANTTIFFTTGALDYNHTYRIQWNVIEQDTKNEISGNISGSDGNITVFMNNGFHSIEATLWKLEDGGNGTWWSHIDYDNREIVVGENHLQTWIYYDRGILHAEMHVHYPDEEIASFYTTWEIIDFNGNVHANGTTEFIEYNYAYFDIYETLEQGDYTIHLKLESDQSNSTLDEFSVDFNVYTTLRVEADSYHLTEAGTNTIHFTVLGYNTNKNYKINWTLKNETSGNEVSSGIVNNTDMNQYLHNFTINLAEGSYSFIATLLENSSYGNVSEWNYVQAASIYIHVGGAKLYSDFWSYNNHGNLNAHVDYGEPNAEYSFGWNIKSVSGDLYWDEDIEDEEHHNHFWRDFNFDDFNLSLGDYVLEVLLYENNILIDSNYHDFEIRIYLSFEDNVEEWEDGNVVEINYKTNTEDLFYILNYTLYHEYQNETHDGQFGSILNNNTIKFYNLPEGSYNLIANIATNESGHSQNVYYFYVSNGQTFVNSEPHCEIIHLISVYNESGNWDLNGSQIINTGDNIEITALVDVTRPFTFSVECKDDDGHELVRSVVMDHPNFATPFLFAEEIIPDGSQTSPTNFFVSPDINFSASGVYGFGVSVEDEFGAKKSYAFTVTLSEINSECQPNYDPNATNLTNGECCSSGAQCASQNCNYNTWVCEAGEPADNSTNNNSTANDDILQEIEPDELPSVSLFVSVIILIFISCRKKR